MIRTATVNDVPGIARLNQRVQDRHAAEYPHFFKKHSGCEFTAWFSQLLDDKDSYLLVASESGRLAGYLFAKKATRVDSWVRPKLQYVMLHHIAVAEEYEGTGIGTGLMERLWAHCRSNGIARVELDVWAFNHRARRFFSKFGFSTFNLRMDTTIEGLSTKAVVENPVDAPH